MRILSIVIVLALWGAWHPTAAAAPEVPTDPGCGRSPHDWCAGPKGDPCAAHTNEAACRADPKCHGVQYRGESVVACRPDGKGFWSNCPAVGCVSRPETK